MSFFQHVRNVGLAIALLLGAAAQGTAAQARDIEAGPIWHDHHARERCPGVCRRHDMRWTGHWRTTQWGSMSVCNCAHAAGGPIGVAPRQVTWVRCASEHQVCHVPYPTRVAYGARGAFARLNVNAGPLGCNNRTFGDPLVGVVKGCFYEKRH